jgi:hypothetical protein
VESEIEKHVTMKPMKITIPIRESIIATRLYLLEDSVFREFRAIKKEKKVSGLKKESCLKKRIFLYHYSLQEIILEV